MEHPSDILMAQNSKDIDIIIGGHSHTFLKNAVEVENLEGRKVVITQCGGQGVIVGRMDIPTPVRP
jgi:5'-nucleotidase